VQVRELLAPLTPGWGLNARPSRRQFLESYQELPDTRTVAKPIWGLHQFLTIESGNAVFTLILQRFKELYRQWAACISRRPKRTRSRKVLCGSVGRRAARDAAALKRSPVK